jgi:MYXO-CTERM domain-containing protein
MRRELSLLVASFLFLVTHVADAFCGFYVSGADAKLFNDATVVVLLRDGTTTVLSMQNNYKGPPEDFAMVVPVPVVLQKDNVKTLPRDVFTRVDQVAAPRLVEYWEQDPCQVEPPYAARMGNKSRVVLESGEIGLSSRMGVKIEARFTVGEYEILILSAKDSGGLDQWLRLHKYKIPDGAEPILRPYVQQGSKFFVAKVNTSKVRFENGQAMLSPLRFHYDSKEFALPVRLGLLNSSGSQDLIVHILARGQRYELANYDNVTIPTNIEVKADARKRFGEFYMALFAKVLAKHPRAMVTEYAWQADKCDPCPAPAIQPEELVTLGADVVLKPEAQPAKPKPVPRGAPPQPRMPPMVRWDLLQGWVLTRLHARYDKNFLGEDLIFRAAPPIAGGREIEGPDGKIETGAQPWNMNSFQGRYVIRHAWTGPISCDKPRRGIWGGPPPGVQGSTQPESALRLASVPLGKTELAPFLAQDLSELGVAAIQGGAPVSEAPSSDKVDKPASPAPASPPASEPQAGGCGSCSVGTRAPSVVPAALVSWLVLGFFAASRRRRS